MDLHSLTNEPGAKKTAKRRGRGRASGLGKTSGRGHKGQFARKGHKSKLGFEGGQMPLLRRLPKRGFKNPTRCPYGGVNVEDLNNFAAGTEVTPCMLAEAGLFDGCRVKILARGEITVALTVKAHAFSAEAEKKITAAGGKCEIVE